jgi:two-component system C4-dicarboxylate transport sensor histidine kinase DctB
MILHAPLRQAGIVPALPELAAPVAVVARRVELEQVLVNLLRNAIEATGPSREVVGPVLAIAVKVAATQVEIAVVDRGSGLDDESLALLFTPFRTTKPRGLGLGLVISQDIVTAFGGSLTATSRPGEGSVFTITLKRAG